MKTISIPTPKGGAISVHFISAIDIAALGLEIDQEIKVLTLYEGDSLISSFYNPDSQCIELVVRHES